MVGKSVYVINILAFLFFVAVCSEIWQVPQGDISGNGDIAFEDFQKQIAFTKAVIEKQERPYETDTYAYSGSQGPKSMNEKLSVYPGRIVFIIPFSMYSPIISARVWFLITLIFGSFFLVYGLIKIDSSSNQFQVVENHYRCEWCAEVFGRYTLSVFFFFRSQAMFKELRLGQLTTLTCVLLLWTIFCRRQWLRGLLLSMAAALKYSLVPIFGLMFLVKRQYTACLFALVFFIVWSIAPGFFGYNIITFYQDYFMSMITSYGVGGPNWFGAKDGFDFDYLQFEFFKRNWINFLGKGFIVIALILALWKECRKSTISLNFLLFASGSTMVLCYHRSYDLILVEILLIWVCNQLYVQNRWTDFWICVGFLFGFALPMSWTIDLSNLMGGPIGENSWIYIGSGGWQHVWKHSFPLLAIYTYGFTLYSAYLYFYRRETCALELGA